MPHGHSWWSLIPSFNELQAWARAQHGPSWISHADISLQAVVTLAFLVIVFTLIGLVVRGKVSNLATDQDILPEGKFSIRTFVEGFTNYVYSTLVEMMGKKAAKFFLPLIGTCAFVIFFSNALGIIPGFLPPSSNLSTTMAMALVIFFATHIFGLKENGLGHLKHFLGPFLPLAPLMLPIEIISHLARPVTLAVRLMANLTADHLVLGIFLGLFAGMGAIGFLIPVPLAIYFLGCIVVVVQTMVFCLLSTVYIAMAIESHDDHH